MAPQSSSIDEVGYIPFEAEAANLFFQLIFSRYERASVIVTSDKPFGRWGEVPPDRRQAPVRSATLTAIRGATSVEGLTLTLRQGVK